MSTFVTRGISGEAAARPDALAVVARERPLTYGMLERRANALAHRLRTLGVGTDAIVAVVAPRSAELIVAALAVLKAGGAYLPLDPTYPRERLAFMLADAEPAVVLHATGLASALPSHTCPTIEVDAMEADEADRPPPAAGETSAHLAYVIYTSGSTGQPKGVECTRRGLANLVRWHRAAFEIG